MGFLKSIIAAPHLERAQRKIIERDYMGAIKSIRSLSKIVGFESPSEFLPVRANIIVLQASYWTDNADLSLQAATVIKKQLLNLAESNSRHDLMYTIEYVIDFAKFCSSKFPQCADDLQSIVKELIAVIEPFDLARVSPNLKYEMPLSNNDR